MLPKKLSDFRRVPLTRLTRIQFKNFLDEITYHVDNFTVLRGTGENMNATPLGVAMVIAL